MHLPASVVVLRLGLSSDDRVILIAVYFDYLSRDSNSRPRAEKRSFSDCVLARDCPFSASVRLGTKGSISAS